MRSCPLLNLPGIVRINCSPINCELFAIVFDSRAAVIMAETLLVRPEKDAFWRSWLSAQASAPRENGQLRLMAGRGRHVVASVHPSLLVRASGTLARVLKSVDE